MRADVVDQLDAFMANGNIWDPTELGALVEQLATDPDPITALLARPLGSLLIRLQMDGLAARTAVDVEAIIWPRLWKVVEGAKSGLPDTELRIRIEVLNRRLARRFAEEDPGVRRAASEAELDDDAESPGSEAAAG